MHHLLERKGRGGAAGGGGGGKAPITELIS